MFNFKKLVILLPTAVFITAALSGCASEESETRILRIYNSEDYIYEYEEGDEEYAPEGDEHAYQEDMIDQFAAYWKETHNEEVEVIYDTFDTNETMFNELKTGKTTYDVIVTSDYMVQKLASKDMLYKFPEEDMDYYWENISDYMTTKLQPIDIFTKDGENVGNLTQYCVPYMWGTIGIMYNPAKYIEEAPEFYINRLGDDYDPEADLYDQALDLVIEDFSSWEVLYRTDEGNPYSNSFSIKDSVRDTFAIATIHANQDKIRDTVIKMGDEAPEGIADIINIPTDKLNDKEYIEEVMSVGLEDMQALKANAFGFETDSGKTDMTTQKIGANLCWSGDATWAMTEAEDFGLELYFSLPLGTNEENYSASNIWFDCFAMPRNHTGDEISEEEQAQYDLTKEFINFMGQPEIAVQNSYCVGYTPATSGEEVLDYMLDCYECSRAIEYMEEDYANLMSIDYDQNSYLFNMKKSKMSKEELEIFEAISEFESAKDFQACLKEYREEIDAEIEFYENATEEDMYDLSYFFGDEFVDDEGNNKAIFVPYSYYAQRQLKAQYPNADELNRLAIMKDFGDVGTQALLDTWEKLRTNSLPTWAIIVLCIEGAAALGLAGYFIAKVVSRKKLKKARNA